MDTNCKKDEEKEEVVRFIRWHLLGSKYVHVEILAWCLEVSSFSVVSVAIGNCSSRVNQVG